MRLLDLFTNFLQENRDLSELERLQSRLARFNGATEERRQAVCSTILERVLFTAPQAAHPHIRKAAAALLQGILRFDALFAVTLGNVTGERSTAKLWEATALARRELAFFEDRARAGQIEEVLTALLHNIIPDYLPPLVEDTPPQLHAPFYALYQQPALAVEAAIGVFLTNQKSKELSPGSGSSWNLISSASPASIRTGKAVNRSSRQPKRRAWPPQNLSRSI